MHNGITFGVGIGIVSSDHDIVTVVLLHLVPYRNDSITNGNRPQNIVTHLVPDQSDSVIIDTGPSNSTTFGTMPKTIVL